MKESTLGVRLEPELDRELSALARKQGRSRSDLAREAIRRYLQSAEIPREARRQSLLVSRRKVEKSALDFIEHAADLGDE
jgi:RHH-type rel operon transcriptional repressor/antitoxin RelB